MRKQTTFKGMARLFWTITTIKVKARDVSPTQIRTIDMVDTRRSVLIIEDHIDSAEMLITILSILDYVVLYAESRDRALQILESHGEPDCLITDWFMPGMTMPEFMEVLRERHPNLPVLAVSAASHLAEKAALLKIDRHLTKPYTMEQVAEAITACIGLRKKKPDSGI